MPAVEELLGVENYIILEPDPRLHERWPEADWETTEATADRMLAMSKRGATDGRSLGGLSSVQVELAGRVVTYKRWNEGGFGVLKNPVVIGRSKQGSIGIEGCFSLGANQWYHVYRPYWALIKHDVGESAFKVTRLGGYDVRFCLHEIDHINGVLISDHGELRKEPHGA